MNEEFLPKKLGKGFDVTKTAIISVVILIIVISIIFFLPKEKKALVEGKREIETLIEESEGLQKIIEEKINWCVENTKNGEAYISCKGFQELNKEYCESAYNKMDPSLDDIEKQKNECLFDLELLNLVNSGKPTECSKIAKMEGYDKEESWIVSMCYVLAANSREVCEEIDVYAVADMEDYPGERKEFCNLFFDCLENKNFEELEDFKRMEQENKEWIILLKATKEKKASLCDKIEYPLFRMYCKIWSGDSEAQKEGYCDILIEECYDPKLYNLATSSS